MALSKTNIIVVFLVGFVNYLEWAVVMTSIYPYILSVSIFLFYLEYDVFHLFVTISFTIMEILKLLSISNRKWFPTFIKSIPFLKLCVGERLCNFFGWNLWWNLLRESIFGKLEQNSILKIRLWRLPNRKASILAWPWLQDIMTDYRVVTRYLYKDKIMLMTS